MPVRQDNVELGTEIALSLMSPHGSSQVAAENAAPPD